MRVRMGQATEALTTLTLQEVCAALRVTRRTATNLIGRGELAAFKVGQAWRVEARDLQAYIARQKQAVRPGLPQEEAD
jgi:excisionase family DNA binding protein